ncbi:MAG: hypothetical protein V4726_09025 [Verrucomicrobiota bacterium]
MNTPPSASIPPDPLSDEGLENRLHQTAPAPLDAVLMARLRQARPVLSESQTAAFGTGSGPRSAPGPVLRARRVLIPFRKPLAAAALAACAWAGWRATAPDSIPGPAHPTASVPENPPDSPPGLEFLPSQESRQHLLSVRELGVVRDSRQRPVRLMSATWLDENTYGDSALDPALRESRLRHEIVPVLLPTY